MNHGISIYASGDWRLTVNYEGDAWSLDTQQVVGAYPDIPPGAYQGMYSATGYRSLDGKKLAWSAGWGWIGFATSRATLDVKAELISKTGTLSISSATDSRSISASTTRFIVALTPLGIQSLGREASPPEENMAIDLPPEVVESLRTFAQQLAE